MKGLYIIKNLVNDKLYIGMSNNIYDRRNAHYSLLKRNRHHNQHLQNAYNKYGKENFEFSIIFQDIDISLLELEEKEKQTIQLYSKGFKLYNKTIGKGYYIPNEEEAKKKAIICRRNVLKAVELNKVKVILTNIKTKEKFSFNSIKEACEQFKLDRGTLSKLINKKTSHKTIKGFLAERQ